MAKWLEVLRDADELWYRQHEKLLRNKRRIALEFEKAGEIRMAQKLMDCAETEQMAVCLDCGQHWWVKTHCDQRICPICGVREGIKRSDKIKALAKRTNYPKLITLTMRRWRHNPKRGIQYLRKSINMLRKADVFEGVVGGAYTIELKRKEDGWHIHAHMVVDGPYIAFPRLRSAWGKIIHTHSPLVNVAAVTNEKALQYVTKYAVKAMGGENDVSHVVEWWQATRGVRLWSCFGSWYNADVDVDAERSDDAKERRGCPYCGATENIMLASAAARLYGEDILGLNRLEGGPYHLVREGMVRRRLDERDDPEDYNEVA